MAIDPNEKLIYLGRNGQNRPYWWESGLKVPAQQPRDIRWHMPDDQGSLLVITLDLKDCRMFCRFQHLTPETEANIVCRE